MNPIPYGGALPTATFPGVGYLELLMLLSVASVVVILGFMIWAGRGSSRMRARLFCPVRLRRVRVVLGLAPSGMPTDVLRCSEFRGNGTITCGKACLQTTVT